jgi:hypothetical protein
VDGDVQILCAAWNLGKSEINFMKTIAKKEGALRGVIKTYNLALVLARGDDQPLAKKHLESAWANLSGN